MNKPYKDTLNKKFFIREFSENINQFELVWHRDKEDRIIQVIGKTDWKFQLDNSLPQEINRIFIPKETYHRLIKGSNNLKLKIWQLG